VSPTDHLPIRVMRIIARMNVGGPAVQISGLMRGINSNDFEQGLYTGFCDSSEADYLEMVATDVKVTRIENLGRHVSPVGDMKAFISLVKEIRSFKPHIVHTHTAKAGFLGRIASLFSMQRSIRVHTFHGHLLDGYFGSLKRRFMITVEQVLALFTHQLLAVGDKVRQDLLDQKIGRLSKFGLMAPGLEISQLPDKKIAQESYHLATTVIQCAFIGRVTQIKRPDRFLDVVGEIKKRGLPINFYMVGDGELLETCRERIERQNLPVSILGWQVNIEKVLAAADIVLLTSDNEGTPLSLIQAGMAGLPVVTTRVGSISEIVLNGQTGIITSQDIDEMADALQKLANNYELRTTMGKAAQNYTLANFGVQRLVNDHENLYMKLLKRE
jgi:glycosyltransferase involved in cell wall biosynthesis